MNHDKVREALREAAELLHSYQTTLGPTRASTSDDDDARLWDRIDACREALAAQPAPGVPPTQAGQWNKAAARAWRDAVLTGSASAADRLLVVSAHVAGQRAALGESLEATLAFPDGEVGRTPPAPSVPDGWKPMPNKATPEMVRAACLAMEDGRTISRIYDAMLAAAPKVGP